MTPSYDYVIVGAGSAGCTLAGRLTEDPGVRVLLLEAGGWDRDPWLQIPLGWGRIMQKRLHDWMYDTEPAESVGGRRIECARGKVIGGSSSTNAMAYVRGHRADYDRWAASGAAGWSYAEVLPYFRRQESWEGGADPYRGGDGPLTVAESRYQDPLIEAYAEAGARAGHPTTPDYNGAEQHGFGRMQMTIRDGRRCSAARAYLHPALARANLTVTTHAHVTRVLMDRRRARGVEYLKGSHRTTVHAEREVILAGGTINSPQTLMLSGIGDPDALKAHGIPVAIPLSGVGRDLQDHPAAIIFYRRRAPGPFVANMRLDRLALGLANAYLRGQGFPSALPGGITAFLKSQPGEALPDVQLLFIAGPLFNARPHLPPFSAPFADGFACRIVVLRPESRGHIALASADPLAAPRIHQSLLATDKDCASMRRGIRLFREIGLEAPLRPFVERELTPGPAQTSDRQIDAYLRGSALTAHHPAGTCRMGAASDTAAVVDPELRVLGTEGLRVVDASVFPDLVGGNINAAVIMIAERAADLIRSRCPLVPTHVADPEPAVARPIQG